MPPTDEEYVDAARVALTMLIAQADASNDRARCRSLAAQIRALVQRAEKTVAPGAADDLVEKAEAAPVLSGGRSAHPIR